MKKATVLINGKQFRVAEGDKVFLELKDAQGLASSRKSITPDQVLLLEDDGQVTTSQDKLSKLKVKLTVKGFVRSKKIPTMKYKRRKRYNVYMTSRREFVRAVVESIS
jgi:ribosomal protein L21